MAIVKIFTNQGILVYEANTAVFDLDTHAGVQSFEDKIYSMARSAQKEEELQESQEGEE